MQASTAAGKSYAGGRRRFQPPHKAIESERAFSPVGVLSAALALISLFDPTQKEPRRTKLIQIGRFSTVIQPEGLHSRPAPDLQSQSSKNPKTPGERSMANTSLPPEERNLTPDQVEALDKRRDWGLTLQVIAGQFAVICVVLSLWVGQDLTYSPGWVRPMFYWDAILFTLAAIFAIAGIRLRRGSQEFLSY